MSGISLEKPIWSALTTRQRQLAKGSGRAWRYPADVAPFADILDVSDESLTALGDLVVPRDRIALFTLDQISVPKGTVLMAAKTAHQMVLSSPAAEGEATSFVPLGVADVPEMQALVEVTKPGPFGARTIELGSYFGLRVGGQLVAMVGERMKLDGFTEISAVCTHPDHRGRGHSRALVSFLAGLVQDRGEVPFLHVFSDNGSAIALYEKLGFERTRTFHVTVLGRS